MVPTATKENRCFACYINPYQPSWKTHAKTDILKLTRTTWTVSPHRFSHVPRSK